MTLDATKLELGPANVYIFVKPRASLTTAIINPNDDLTFRAQLPGAAGNSITIEYVVSGTNTPLSVVVTGADIVVNLATDGGGTATSTADDVKNAVNSSPQAFFLVYAVRAPGNDGTGVLIALVQTSLAGGSDTGVATNIGFLGDDLAVTIATEASPLTGAQTGTIPQDKVITGGSFQVTIPIKEITLENFARGIPNAIFIQGATADRVEFISKVGQSMRDRAVKMEIRKILGGFESADREDILVIPEIAPVDAEVALPFSPTDQRIITATFEAWPDANGRWAFFGTEIL